DWPQSKNPDEVAPQSESEPEEIGGFRVTDRRYQGTIDNGGGRIVAEDGFLSRVSDAGRVRPDLRARIQTGESAPAPDGTRTRARRPTIATSDRFPPPADSRSAVSSDKLRR